MKSNIKFIKFFLWASIILLPVCIIIDLCDFEILCISSNLILSIFGGLFASFVVSLITEIKKYLYNKEETESNIYKSWVALYTELAVQLKVLEHYLDNKEKPIPDNALSNRMPYFQACSDSLLYYFDYNTFKKNNTALNEFADFIKEKSESIEKHIKECYKVLMSIRQTKIFYAQMSIYSKLPSTSDRLVHEAVCDVKKSAEELMNSIDLFLTKIEHDYPGHFNWSKDKKEKDNISFEI